MLKQITKSKGLNTGQITKIGMLSAITIVLGMSPWGFIQLPIAKATIMHIPVIIGAILEGPLVGAMIGLIFGLFSMLKNIISPTSILSFAFINPMVSVLPRILIAITTYYVYSSISKKNNSILGVAVGTVVGSMTNTIGVLAMIYFLYIQRVAEVKNITINGGIKLLYVIASTNGVAEAIVATVLVVPIVLTVKRIKKK